MKLADYKGWLAAIAGTLALLVATVNTYWPLFGWVTPNQHDADVAQVEAEHEVAQEPVLSAIKALSVKVDINQKIWQCDEDMEELIDLKTQQVNGDQSVETQVRIDTLTDAIDEADCHKLIR